MISAPTAVWQFGTVNAESRKLFVTSMLMHVVRTFASRHATRNRW